MISIYLLQHKIK